MRERACSAGLFAAAGCCAVGVSRWLVAAGGLGFHGAGKRPGDRGLLRRRGLDGRHRMLHCRAV